MYSIETILKQYWGYDTFRSMQPEIIDSILAGRDTLALLPTGGGKSICFQVPAMITEGLCLVVSPLIALMKDQVEGLNKKGIPALSVYSGMSFWEVKRTLENAAQGNFKFLYLSPERLESKLFLEYLPALSINLIAVDEAHCVSQWGYDFRPPYLRIAKLREQLPGIPILALTASATKDVQNDICDKLAFKKDHQRFQKSFERANLSYSVFNVPAKQNKLLEIFKNVKGTGIVYCKSRKRTKEIAELLNNNKLNADHYHAGLSSIERTNKQENWIKNKTRIIVCTNAFGMGIDKSDVRAVAHYDVPDALENYYQEAGRAGRDGKRAYAVLLYNENELSDLTKQPDIKYPSAEAVKNIYKALVNYLQLPAGSGEGEYFDFDINDFVKKFKLNIYTANFSLKILEQEDVIVYNEQMFLPSTVIFTTDKNTLHEFEKINPELEQTLKGLLRSYEGIFDNITPVYENQLAGFIKKDAEKIKEDLKKLQQFGIIEYQPQKDKPQIQFLKNRVATQDFTINKADLIKRKNAFTKRMLAMLAYVKNNHTCRSKLVGNYFNDATIKSCGICDNCINEKELGVTPAEFDNISGAIVSIVKNNPIAGADLLKNLALYKKEKVWKVLNYLQSEDKISITKEGIIVKG